MKVCVLIFYGGSYDIFFAVNLIFIAYIYIIIFILLTTHKSLSSIFYVWIQ